METVPWRPVSLPTNVVRRPRPREHDRTTTEMDLLQENNQKIPKHRNLNSIPYLLLLSLKYSLSPQLSSPASVA